MTNGIISLESLITFAKEKDRAGDSLHGASAAGKVLGSGIINANPQHRASVQESSMTYWPDHSPVRQSETILARS